MSGAAGRGAAAAALIVTLGSAAPAFAAPWAAPSLHGVAAGGSVSGADSGPAAAHHTHSSGHVEHEGSHLTSGDGGHDSHDASAGSDDAHEEHGGDAAGHEDHDSAGSDASAGADGGHDSHDGDASSGHSGDSSEHSDDAGHGGEPDTVSEATKTRVLGGFGVVNAVAVGGAFLLRRRDRKHATKAGRVRADQSRPGRSR